MLNRTVSVLMLALLMVSSFAFTIRIEPAKAWTGGTITIQADGSINPPDAPISTTDNITYTLTDNINVTFTNNTGIVGQRNNIIIDGNGHTLQGIPSGYGIYLSGINNVTIRNTQIKTFGCGICLRYGVGIGPSFDNSIIGNNITNNGVGITLYHSSNNSIGGNNITNNSNGITLSEYSGHNSISGNNITKSFYGIALDSSSNNTLIGNNITNNWWYGISLINSSNNNIISGNNITAITAYSEHGIEFGSSFGNRIFHNNFAGNPQQIQTYSSVNVWDDGYPSGGNYWSDYNGTDANQDGIGDTPYIIASNNTDRYPLIKPNGWIHNTTLVFSLTPSTAYVGQSVTLQGTLKDEYNRPLNNTQVNVYSNGTLVAHLQTNSTGEFKATGTPMSSGTYTVKVSFNGSSTLKPSSYTQTLTLLRKVSTKVSFTLSPNPAKMGVSITLAGNLTNQANAPIANVPVEISYSIDNGINWKYAGTLQTNSTGGFKATGKLATVGVFLVKVSYKGNFKYNPGSHIETLTINP